MLSETVKINVLACCSVSVSTCSKLLINCSRIFMTITSASQFVRSKHEYTVQNRRSKTCDVDVRFFDFALLRPAIIVKELLHRLVGHALYVSHYSPRLDKFIICFAILLFDDEFPHSSSLINLGYCETCFLMQLN